MVQRYAHLAPHAFEGIGVGSVRPLRLNDRLFEYKRVGNRHDAAATRLCKAHHLDESNDTLLGRCITHGSLINLSHLNTAGTSNDETRHRTTQVRLLRQFFLVAVFDLVQVSPNHTSDFFFSQENLGSKGVLG